MYWVPSRSIGASRAGQLSRIKKSSSRLLATIKTRVYALNFADDEFNPAELHVLEELMPRVREGRFIVLPGSLESFGHLTMAHPELWSEHVAEFMRSLGDDAVQSSNAY